MPLPSEFLRQCTVQTMPAALLQGKTLPGLRAADARARQAVALLVICTVVQRWDVLEACYTDAGILPVASWRTQV